MTRRSTFLLQLALVAAAAAGRTGPASAQAAAAPPADAIIDPVVVTATRNVERSLDIPASVDTIGTREIQQGQPMVNLSETLVRVPGIVANNRQNYAQDLQISSRGYGARAAFGVRGLRLYQDDIPQTMPDGQGQTGSFSLLATERIEVLRGPFSTLYGNASGGVIAVFTESGTPSPVLALTGGAGSDGVLTLGARLTGPAPGGGYVVAGSHFQTDGYRDHSEARRELGVAKLVFSAGDATRITLLGTTQSQPESQDPLGLTRAQWDANPRQVDPVAIQFDTRKTVNQDQGGATVEHRFDADTTLRTTAYVGRRMVRQYLSFSGVAPTSSGGVTDLDRDYGGVAARLSRRYTLAGQPLTFTLGGEFESQNEHRRGFVNNEGDLGDLRRDEDDKVTSTAAFAQVEWWALPTLSLTAGVRATEVRFKTFDHYVNAQNPDDSGRRDYRQTTPALGVLWQPLPTLSLYAAWGEGFETPTFAELAYRPSGPGLNLGLDAATSRATEVGVKVLLARRQRLNFAAFSIDTDDEIVVDTASGGRTTFKNAGKTKRRGAELAYDGEWDNGVRAHAAYTWLQAEFANDIVTGTPPVVVPSGNQLPAVPKQTAYGELAWRPPALAWLEGAVEAQYVAKLYVNERNTDAAPAYALMHLRVGAERELGGWRLRGFVRLNNVTDRRYVGSVIVGDANGRFFEPAPGRTVFVGASANARF